MRLKIVIELGRVGTYIGSEDQLIHHWEADLRLSSSDSIVLSIMRRIDT